MQSLRELLAIPRAHIIGIAVTATVVFGWLLGERYLVSVAVVTGIDWLLINLLNRATDIEEDLANRIPGTAWLARHSRAARGACLALLVASFPLTHLLHPELTANRAAIQLIGLGYSVALIPTPWGMRRLKDLYLLKNLMSAVLFVLTVFIHPLIHLGWQVQIPGGLAAVAMLVAFFVPFELTYEILYDLRDLDGDRQRGVPTFPVVHGAETAQRIIHGLLAAAALALVAGLGTGLLGIREGLMLAAPAVQLLFCCWARRRELQPIHCINLTHLGTVMLAAYLAGTRVWQALGLPENIYLVS